MGLAGLPTNPNAHLSANVAAHPADTAVGKPDALTELESAAHSLTSSLSPSLMHEDILAEAQARLS